MRNATLVIMASAGLLSSALAASAAGIQPPMGDFDGAFYACDQGRGFQISYDAKDAKTATVTTSDNNAEHQLKRVSSTQGPEFSDGTMTVDVSGQGAQVQGARIALTGCKLKTTT